MSRQLLLIDTDPECTRILEQTLIPSGFTVVHARGERDAVRLLTSMHLSAAIVGHTGDRTVTLGLLRHLAEEQPGCLRLLLLGRPDARLLQEAINSAGVHRVLRRPLEPDSLRHAVTGALRTNQRTARATLAASAAWQQRTRTALHDCLRMELLYLVLQPIVRLTPHGPDVMGHEVLLRSRHPELATPQAVLEAATRSGGLTSLNRFIFEQAAILASRIPSEHKIFVNLLPQQLGMPSALARDAADLLALGERVVFELTERQPLDHVDGWEDGVRLLTSRGCGLAVDDLGAGYSSLGMLAGLQPTHLKLDQSLVRDVDTDPRKRRIARMLCRFADSTQAQLIAEGVQTMEEAMTLWGAGVQLMQGFWFARPSVRPVRHVDAPRFSGGRESP